MFEWVPFLAGEYLTYQEYYALTYFMAFFVKFIFCFTLANQLYAYAYYEKPISGFIITGTRDLVKAIACIVTCYSFLILTIAISWWSAFSIVPIYVTIILNILTALVIYAYILLKMKNVKSFHFFDGLQRIRKQYSYILLFVFIAFLMPIFFDRTCVCLYEDHKEYIMPYNILGYECLLNTRLYRSLTMDEQCKLEEPCHVFATLPEDTAHEVFINIQTHVSIEKLELRYTAGVINSFVQRFDDLEPRGQRLQHIFYVNNLLPGTNYRFEYTLGTKTYQLNYRTLRAQYTVQNPLRLASGGDVGNSKAAKEIWKQLQQFDLEVILIGGDLAYDNNNVNCYWTWDLYLDELDNLQKAKNRVIPIIQAIGNHDIGLNPYPRRQIQLKSNQAYPIYFSYFPQHLHKGNIPPNELRKSFFIQKLGQYVLFTLDSAYLSSHAEQALWIDNYLKINKITGLLAQYHHPIYSSSKIADFEGKVFQLGQLYWTSRFDKYNFRTVYENHQHIHKRSFLLRNQMRDSTGVLYLGDGCWGANISDDDLMDQEYLANVQRVNSIWISEYNGGKTIKHIAIGVEGQILDQFTYDVQQAL